MADETNNPDVTEKVEKKFVHGHAAISLYGDKDRPPIAHQFEGRLSHSTSAQHPLVHMVCWESEQTCRVDVSGRVLFAGDDKSPIPLKITHYFEGARCKLEVEPVKHTLDVSTELARPIHHALQMRTPLQVRFCNTWQVASDYLVDVKMGERSLFSIHLTGATVATPQPCPEEEPCPPAMETFPRHP